MGGSSYNAEERGATRGVAYAAQSVNETFKQNVKRVIHEAMDPKGVTIRESRDSDIHPNAVPIIVGLDVTGSMQYIPHELIKDGLPKLVTGIIQAGIPSPALLFIGVGDHECDKAPLQIGQFESGDEELDMWLERTYLEGGGGGNTGESYHLAWYFAAHHTVHDSWEKRKQKGFLITIGDEPCLPNLPASAVKEIMGEGQESFTKEELLARASETYNVFHIHVHHNSWRTVDPAWEQLLGENLIVTDDYTKIPNIIQGIVVGGSSPDIPSEKTESEETKEEVKEKPKPTVL